MFAIIAGAVLATAQAGISGDVSCIVDRLPPSARAAIVDEARSGQGGAVRAAFDEAGRICAGEKNWSAEHSRRMVITAAGTLLSEEAGGRLRQIGVPTASIDRWVARQPASVGTDMNISREAMGALMAALQAEGVSVEAVNTHAETIGLYVAARLLLEQVAEGRPQER